MTGNSSHLNPPHALLGDGGRLFCSFADNSADVLRIVDAMTGRISYLSPAFSTIWGELPEAVLADAGRWLALVHPEDRERAAAVLPRVLAGESVVAEYRIVRASDGATRWICDTCFPVRGEGGAIGQVGGIARDVTESKRGSDRQASLSSELQHRVRNNLALIRSIVSRTAENSENVEAFGMHLQGRIATLARVQTLLSRDVAGGLDLENLILGEFLAQGAEPLQVSVEGPKVQLAPKAGEVLTLAIHEMTTNAIKFGALSRPEGRVAVIWSVERQCDPAWLDLQWEERGGPRMAAGRTGFGHDVITGLIPYELDGRGEFDVRADGLCCRIGIPLGDRMSLKPVVQA